MKRETLKETIFANIGGLFLAIGLCLLSKYEWNLYYTGGMITLLGIISFIAMIPIHRQLQKGEKINWKDVAVRLIIFNIAIVVGLGIGQILTNKNLVVGIIIWICEIILSIVSYPFMQYYRHNHKKLINTIIGTTGGIISFAGICMTFFKKQSLIYSGTIIGLIGILMILYFFYRNRDYTKDYYYIDLRFISTVIIEIIAGFISVYGFVSVCNTAINGDFKIALIRGVITCTIGFLISILAIPIYLYMKTNNICNKKIKIDKKNKEIVYPFRNLVLIFFFYGFLGWLTEFLFFGITSGHFANRGFVHLPILPIYGFGGSIVSLIFSKNQKWVFFKSAVIVSALEYVTSVVLEKIFNQRWWDYSSMPFNFQGRICLFNCLIFGLGGFVMAKFISPYLNLKLKSMNKNIVRFLSVIFSIILIVDFVVSVMYPHVGLGITV